LIASVFNPYKSKLSYITLVFNNLLLTLLGLGILGVLLSDYYTWFSSNDKEKIIGNSLIGVLVVLMAYNLFV
jgi:hypothetical protein